MKKPWFKRKLYGWGWTPATWEGWLTIILYVVFVTCAPFAAMFLFDIEKDSEEEWIAVLFALGAVIILTPLLIWTSYRKGERPTWQWGKREEDEEEGRQK